MVSKKSAQGGQIGQKITKNRKAIPWMAKKVLGTLKNDQNCPKVTKSVTFSVEPVKAGQIFVQLNKNR